MAPKNTCHIGYEISAANINYQKMLAYHYSSLHIIFQFQFIYDQKEISLTFNTLHTKKSWRKLSCSSGEEAQIETLGTLFMLL